MKSSPDSLELDDIRAALTRTPAVPVTLGQLLACWVTHDLAHVTQIARVLVRYVGRDVGPWRAYFSLLR
jgi:hypothetical protein